MFGAGIRYIAGSMSGFTNQVEIACRTKKGLERWVSSFFVVPLLRGVYGQTLACPHVCCW